jgi:hypothetical protein
MTRRTPFECSVGGQKELLQELGRQKRNEKFFEFLFLPTIYRISIAKLI